MKIAFLGTRGIPARYGGFETFVEAISTRMAARGHSVHVYGRKRAWTLKSGVYQGVRVTYLPTVKTKYWDTLSHTFIATLHVIWTDAEIVYYCNAINSIFMFLPRLFGKKVVINVNGLEWKRKKWNWLGKLAYRVSEWIATLFAHAIISDSRRIKLYYLKKFRKDTVFISYGANSETLPVADKNRILEDFSLVQRKYFLYVSRLEPENNAHLFIKAYEQTKTDMPFVIVGDASYRSSYARWLRSTKDTRIKFLGFVYGDHYRALVANAYVYFHGNEVGGTNPALLEAMAAGNCVIAIGVGFNREVIKNNGLCFKKDSIEDLKKTIEFALQNPAAVEQYRKQASRHIRRSYNWDAVTDQYEDFFKRLIMKQQAC